jgi:opacity protein-like surface antigen
MHRCARRAALAALATVSLAAAAPALAEGAGQIEGDLMGPELTQDDDLHASITPYLWFTGIDGTIGVVEDRAPATPDASFAEIRPHLAAAFMARGEVSWGRWGLMGDIAYLSVKGDDDVQVADPLAVSVDVRVKSLNSTAAVRYRVLRGERTAVDLYAGARITSAKLELELGFNSLPPLQGEASRTWVDPVVGVGVHTALGRRWMVSGYADIGGFGVASDLVWQAYGGISYAFSDHVRVSAGYRYYSVDYRDEPFIFDVNAHGPILGLTFEY